MFKNIFLAAMVAALFSPLCMADDNCAPCAEEVDTGWAGDNRLRMLGLLQQDCGCPSDTCAEEADAGWAGDNRLRMLGLLQQDCGCPSENCAEEINPNWRADTRLRMLGLNQNCCSSECCE